MRSNKVATKAQKSELVRLEAEINNMWGELNTSNMSNQNRQQIKEQIEAVEQQFNAVVAGQSSSSQLKESLQQINQALAFAAIEQAENEVPRAEHLASIFQGLENVRHELISGNITPNQARHEVKQITRPH